MISNKIKQTYYLSIILLFLMILISCNEHITFNDKGLKAFENRDYEKANEYFSKALIKDPKSDNIKFNKAICLYKINNFNDSLKYLEEILKNNTNDSEVLYYKILNLKKINKLEEVLKVYDQLIRLNPKNPAFYYNKAIILHNNKQYEKAIGYYDKADKSDPDNNIELLTNQAYAYFELANYKQTIKLFDKVLSINPKNNDALINKGLALLLLSKPDKAIDCFNKVYMEKTTSKNSRLLLYKAIAYQEAGHYNQSLMLYNKIIQNKPDNVLALYNKINILTELNKIDEALLLYDKIIEIGEFIDP